MKAHLDSAHIWRRMHELNDPILRLQYCDIAVSAACEPPSSALTPLMETANLNSVDFDQLSVLETASPGDETIRDETCWHGN